VTSVVQAFARPEVQFRGSPKAGWLKRIWHPAQFPKLVYSAKMLVRLDQYLFIKR